MIADRIWNDLYDAKKNDFYLSGYLGYLRTKRQRINSLKIIVAFVGIILNKWLDNSSLITLSILTLFELLKEVIPELSINEKLMDKLPEYRMLYVNKFEELDKLYYEIDSENITEEEAKTQYYKIREINLRIEDLDNSIHLPEKLKVFNKAELKTKVYMTNCYHINEGQEET